MPIPEELQDETPLWFYILAEAQAPLVDEIAGRAQLDGFPEGFLLNDPIGIKTQLRGVGGRIVAEVFYGLLVFNCKSLCHVKTFANQLIRNQNNGAYLCN